MRYAAAGLGPLPPGCQGGAVTDTAYLGLDGQPPGTLPVLGAPPTQPWSERWTLQACNKRVGGHAFHAGSKRGDGDPGDTAGTVGVKVSKAGALPPCHSNEPKPLAEPLAPPPLDPVKGEPLKSGYFSSDQITGLRIKSGVIW